MSKFDEIVSFDADVHRYHAAVLDRLPDVAMVQPKHDGSCILAVCLSDKRIVSTLSSFDSVQSKYAEEYRGDSNWEAGVTLMFELIDARDAKTQTQRASDGLYLFYGCRPNGVKSRRAFDI